MKKSLSDTNVFVRTSGADDPHREIKAQLAQFLLALIQAFLRTGYYTPDHPESQKGKIGLYEDFQGLFLQRDELTFLIREEATGKNILIEGVLPEIQDLNSLMIEGMAEMFVPRFAKFLEQKDLIRLTLKNTMTPTEFTNFVDVMSEPSFVETRDKGDKEKFNRTLQEKGIVNTSYIYNEELVTVRNIPWRAQIALTRLKKDFSMIPYCTDLDLEGLRKVRRQIIQDLMRPLRNAEAIYYILANSDLAVTEEFKEAEIDQEIMECLSDDLLRQVSRVLFTEAFCRGEKEAIECLARARSSSAFGKFMEMLKNVDDIPSDRRVQIESCLYRSIAFYGNLERPDIGTLQDFLLKKIDSIVGSGTLRWTTIRKKTIQPEVIAAICETLGKIGTSKSCGVLQKLKKHKDSSWQNKAEREKG